MEREMSTGDDGVSVDALKDDNNKIEIIVQNHLQEHKISDNGQRLILYV